jgi:PadR family transcriptional regulator PadR
MTTARKKILNFFLSNQEAERHGAEIMKAARVSAGTMYPILVRLEKDGMLKSRWESEERVGAKPRRRLYALTYRGVVRGKKEAGIEEEA